jgi:hypothetical protein
MVSNNTVHLNLKIYQKNPSISMHLLCRNLICVISYRKLSDVRNGDILKLYIDNPLSLSSETISILQLQSWWQKHVIDCVELSSSHFYHNEHKIFHKIEHTELSLNSACCKLYTSSCVELLEQTRSQLQEGCPDNSVLLTRCALNSHSTTKSVNIEPEH